MSSIKQVLYNKDLLRIIVSYIIIPKFDIIEWIEKAYNDFEKNISKKIINSNRILYDYYKIMNNYYESYDYLTKNYIDWKQLSSNRYISINFYSKNIDKINWSELSANPNAISLLKKYKNKIDYNRLLENENAIDMIEQNLDKITDITYLGLNKNAIHLIDKYFNIIYKNDKEYKFLNNENIIFCKKFRKKALKYSGLFVTDKNINRNKWCNIFNNKNIHILLEKYIKYIDWKSIQYEYGIKMPLLNNKYAYPFIIKHYKKIDWNHLSYCECPEIIEILKKNIDKINWFELSSNQSNEAIKLFYNNIDKINWKKLSNNNCDEAIKLIKKYPDKISFQDTYLNNNIEIMELYYKYYMSLSTPNYSNIMEYSIWLNLTVPSNRNIFIKNEYKTNKKLNKTVNKIYDILFS